MQFSKPIALELATLCQSAYVLATTGHCELPDGFTAPIAIRMPVGHRPFFLQGDPLGIWGFVTIKAGVLYIVFRGTEITSGLQFLQEWAEDALSLPLARHGAGMVHLGFYSAWVALRDAVASIVADLLVNPKLRIMITGHSLGAAIATLCWAGIGGELMTFACPRVGDPDFAKSLWNGETVRVFNSPDHVPNVPTDPPFRHGGIPQELNGPGDWIHAQTSHSLSSIISPLNALK